MYYAQKEKWNNIINRTAKSRKISMLVRMKTDKYSGILGAGTIKRVGMKKKKRLQKTILDEGKTSQNDVWQLDSHQMN